MRHTFSSGRRSKNSRRSYPDRKTEALHEPSSFEITAKKGVVSYGKQKIKTFTYTKIFLFFISVSVLAAAAVYISYDRIQEKAGEYMLNKQADSILEKMSDEEKAGQLFIGCFYDGMPDSGEIEKYHLGGAVLFKTAFENRLQAMSDHRSKRSTIHP
mgnify:CR=1 FL=1